MAIYYLNPYTQTNGTGTFASPWSASSTTRTGLTDGDEVRILGNTNPLFFSTVYTASYASNYQLTITAGGNLGTDFPAGSYLYIVESDAFCYVGTQTANTLSVCSSLVTMPWANTVLGSTMTIRKVDTANNTTSTSSGTMYILGAPTSLSNVIVSDAWINATTRVTDGTVKSIFRGAGTLNSPVVYFETNQTPTTIANNTFNMQNSHVVPNPYTGSSGALFVRGRDSVINVSQFAIYTTGTGTLTAGVAAYPVTNTTFTIKTVNNYGGFLATTNYANNCTFNITNYYTYYIDYIFAGIAPIASFSNNTINHTNYMQGFAVAGSGSWMTFGSAPAPKITFNYSGIIDYVQPTTPSYGIIGGGGDVSINILPGTTIYKGRRATTGATSLTGRIYLAPGSMLLQKNPIYTANILSSISATANVTAYLSAALFSTTSGGATYFNSVDLKKPAILNLEYPSSTSTANNAHATAPVNILQTYRDGSWDPIEILGIDTKIGYMGSASPSSFPNVFRDTVTFRTTGPSLRSLLATWTSAYWQPATGVKSSSYKNIKIPIVSGSNYTITGYIRSNYASSTTGDVIMSIIYNNSVLATQNMTSAMYNSWEQFTLSFTASATGEAYLVWEMYYPSALSYWLDDLSIVKA